MTDENRAELDLWLTGACGPTCQKIAVVLATASPAPGALADLLNSQPVVHGFAINPKGGPDIWVEGTNRFCREDEFETHALWAWNVADALRTLIVSSPAASAPPVDGGGWEEIATWLQERIVATEQARDAYPDGSEKGIVLDGAIGAYVTTLAVVRRRPAEAVAATAAPEQAGSRGWEPTPWFEERITAAELDRNSHPEGSSTRSFYDGQIIAYENALSAAVVAKSRSDAKGRS